MCLELSLNYMYSYNKKNVCEKNPHALNVFLI